MINELVASLPEIYQPIFGHPELSNNTSRTCCDRLCLIEKIYDCFSIYLNRPLRVLDLGCAQGYISLSLANKGAEVHGIDYLDKNIAVCNYLKDSNPSFKLSFETGLIEDKVKNVIDGEFDIVLGLSVFHHLIHKYGEKPIRDLIYNLISKVGIGIFELALDSEPLYWGPSLPKNPRDIFSNTSFVHKIGSHITHLSEIKRPLYVASQYYVITTSYIEKYSRFSTEPHALSDGTHEGSRRYYFSDNDVIKQYYFDHPFRGEHNRKEFTNEKLAYAEIPQEFNAINCKLIDETDEDAIIVTKRINGELLLDVLRKKTEFNSGDVLKQILEQLIILERQGLYHNDLRAWNIIISDGIVYIIDYGSISKNKSDVAWPYDIFLSFVILINEIASKFVENPTPHRRISLSPQNIAKEYRNWIEGMWNTPASEWSFNLLYESFLQSLNTTDSSVDSSERMWMKSIENIINEQSIILKELRHKVIEVESNKNSLKNSEIDSIRNQLFLCELDKKSILIQSAMENVELRKHQARIVNLTNQLVHLEFLVERNRIEHANLLELENVINKEQYNLDSQKDLSDKYASQLKLRDCELEALRKELTSVKEIEASKELFKNNQIDALTLCIENSEHTISELNFNIDKQQKQIIYYENMINSKDKSLLVNEDLVRSKDKHMLELELNLKEQQRYINDLISNTQTIIESTSWKITAPIRTFKRLLTFPIQLNINNKLKEVIKHIALYVKKRNRLRLIALYFLNKNQNIKRKIKNIISIPYSIHEDDFQTKEINNSEQYLLLDSHEMHIFNKLKNILKTSN